MNNPPHGLTRTEVKSLQKLKELVSACLMYAEKHQGDLPPSLGDAKPYFRDELTGDRCFDISDYDLVASGKIQGFTRPSGEVILIRQKHPLSPGRYGVAFLDCHSAIVAKE